MAKKTYSIEVELTEQQAKSLGKISEVATRALIEIAAGGMILDASIHQQIQAIQGEPGSLQDLVKAVEASHGRRDGSIEATWRPDPSYLPVLEEVAASRGVTVQEMAQDVMDYVTGQGWMYQLAPETKQVFFTREQAKKIAGWLDKDGNFTGQDICNALFAKAKAA